MPAGAHTIMPIHTRRWNDPSEPDDGERILICRYRPRALPKSKETWDTWLKDLGPSKELHAAVWGKGREPLSWSAYRAAYKREMLAQRELIRKLARRVAQGETITLLCSSACDREDRCHRSVLKSMIEAEAAKL